MTLSLHTIKTHFAPWVWGLTAVLLFAPLGRHAEGAVLCVETDGTVTVERAIGSACGSPAAVIASDRHEKESVSLTDARARSHCGACVDVALPVGGDEDCASFILLRGPSAQVDLPVVAVFPLFSFSSDAIVLSVRKKALNAPLSITSPLPTLRSVVLLI